MEEPLLPPLDRARSRSALSPFLGCAFLLASLSSAACVASEPRPGTAANLRYAPAASPYAADSTYEPRPFVSPQASGPAGQSDATAGAADLAAAAQNPIANNISLPFEGSIYPRAGLEKDDAFVLNIQPVIPTRLSDDWNLISRPIIPIIDLPGTVAGLPEVGSPEPASDGGTGLGDINYTAFVSPVDPAWGKLIWGAGPSLTLPTATDSSLGSEKWSLGPSVVGLTISKPWLTGLLWRQLWSFAGESDRADVNQMILQPFVNYNLPRGWYLMTAPIFVSNWQAPSSEQWTVPLGAGAGKLFRIGSQPINVNLQYYYNVERPDAGAEWQVKFVVQFLFKKK